jgi:hypothetical protein
VASETAWEPGGALRVASDARWDKTTSTGRKNRKKARKRKVVWWQNYFADNVRLSAVMKKVKERVDANRVYSPAAMNTRTQKRGSKITAKTGSSGETLYEEASIGGLIDSYISTTTDLGTTPVRQYAIYLKES